MRKAWKMAKNRVIIGMALFLAMVALWEFRVRPEYFPEPLVEQKRR